MVLPSDNVLYVMARYDTFSVGMDISKLPPSVRQVLLSVMRLVSMSISCTMSVSLVMPEMFPFMRRMFSAAYIL